MEGGMPGGPKGGYRSLSLGKGRGHGFEVLIAFDPLPHCDFGDHFPLIARRVVCDIGPVDGDENRTDKKGAEGNVSPQDFATRRSALWQCGEHEHDGGDEGDGGDRLVGLVAAILTP
jgi:hypothetical protein